MSTPLLTPAESMAFHSFLSSVDPEWVMHTEDGAVHVPESPAQGKEALAKATKDLMSLDSADGWNHPAHHKLHNGHRRDEAELASRIAAHLSNHGHDHDQPQPGQHHGEHGRMRQHQPHPHHPERPAFLQHFHAQTRSQSQLPSPHAQPYFSFQKQSSPNDTAQPQYSPTHAIAPEHTVGSAPYPSPPVENASPASEASTYHSPSLPPPTSSKRASTHSAAASNKRARPSPPSSSSASASSSSTLKQPQTKQALLSPSQKKANHIQSEQKRRANIRRGYEALCETVPALREAILLEEQEQAAASGRRNDSRGGGTKKGKGKAKRGSQDDIEKADGRAGPRSENVVLQKTIDYIQDLISERSALLTRLHAAAAVLPPTHPSHPSRLPSEERLWEREWTGGHGHEDEDEEYDE